MGAIVSAVLGLLISGSSAASPPDLMVYTPNGTPGPGEVAEMIVVTHNSGQVVNESAPTVSVDGVKLASPASPLRPGRWSYALPASGLRAQQVVVTHDGARLARTLGASRLPGARLRAPIAIESKIGEAVEFLVTSVRDETPKPSEIAVLGTDGKLTDIRADQTGQGLSVRWMPGDSPFPRTVALGVMDLRSPRIPPEWVIVSLRGQPQIPIQTEPGATVTVTVGGRAGDKQVAGSDGLVLVRPEVRPGETSAIVTTEDELGNTQTSEIALGGDARPVLTVVPSGAIVPGRPMPLIYVHASRAAGRPWTGEAPSCSTTRTGPLKLALLGPGKWRGQLAPATGALDAQVHCDLGGRVQTRTQVRVETGLPTRLSLRAHPSAITADLPSAEVQAFLENALGDRLPSQDIKVRADRGVLQPVDEDNPALVRAVYRGDRAVEVGSDVLRAGVALPSGEGGVWSLDLQTSAPKGRHTILVDGRALDRSGRPLANAALKFRVSGKTFQGQTGPRGWASIEVPWPKRSEVVVAEVAGGGLVRRDAVLPGDPVLKDIGGPDLTATLKLPVLPGRISGVRLVATPRVVEIGGLPAKIEVHLEDRAGKRVLNQTVEITADTGDLTRIQRHQDGRFTTQFSPPADILSGTARIQARTEDGQFTASVDVSMVPRRLRQAIGIVGGGIFTPDTAVNPIAGIEYDRRLPWAPFVFRASAAYTTRQAVDQEPLAGGIATVDLKSVPVSAGVLVRHDGEIVPTWAGLTLVGAVQHIQSSLDGGVVGRGIQLAPPGFHALMGAGWRVRSGEFQAQLGYLFIYGTPGPISWEGPTGGVVGTVGYKVLY